MAKHRPRGPLAADTIAEKRNRRLGWPSALAELIDNSVGNGATVVTVEVSKSEVKITDNGNGCDEAMFAALISIGWHQEDADNINQVSRYGVGAKDAVLWLGGPTEVASIRGDLRQYTEVNWDSFESWDDYEDPVQGDFAAKHCERLGLVGDGVVVHAPAHTRQIADTRFAGVHAALARLFWAAVETGVTIDVTYTPSLKRPRKTRLGGLLPGKPMPATIDEHTINTTVTLEDGRGIRLLGGVLKPEVRWSAPGFEYIYGHRVVIEAGGTGAGPFAFERLYVRVFLLGDKETWEVTTNKAGLHDADEAALSQAVYDASEAILQVAASEAIAQSQDDELLKELSDTLEDASRKKAKRSPPQNKTGTKEATGRGSPHENAEETGDDDGNCQKRKRRRNKEREPFKIYRSEFDDDAAHLFGKASVKDRIVRLNVLHPFVAEALKQRDKGALMAMAWALWSDAWTWMEPSGQRRTAMDGQFVHKMSAMLKVNMP